MYRIIKFLIIACICSLFIKCDTGLAGLKGEWNVYEVKKYEVPTPSVMEIVKEKYLYTGGDSGLIIYDISNPPVLSEINRNVTDAGINDMVIDTNKNRLYLLTSDELIIMNIEEPALPVEIKRITHIGGERIKKLKNFLFIGDTKYTPSGTDTVILIIGSIGSIDSFRLMSRYLLYASDPCYGLTDIDGYDTLLFVGTEDSGVYILDVAVPANPKKVALLQRYSRYEVNICNPRCLKINYPFLYIGESLYIYNVTNPSEPQFIGQSECINKKKAGGTSSIIEVCYSLTLTGNYLLVGADNGPYSGLVVCDVSTPNKIIEIGYSLDSHRAAWSPVMKNSYVYAGCGGIIIYKVSLNIQEEGK